MAHTYFKNLDVEAKKQYVSDVINRCCEVWGVSEPFEIVDELGHRGLGHTASAMKMWISRPTMPWDFILTTALKKNISLDYLLLNVTDGNQLTDQKPAELLELIDKCVADSLFESAEFGIVEHSYISAISKKISSKIEDALTVKVYKDKAG